MAVMFEVSEAALSRMEPLCEAAGVGRADLIRAALRFYEWALSDDNPSPALREAAIDCARHATNP